MSDQETENQPQTDEEVSLPKGFVSANQGELESNTATLSKLIADLLPSGYSCSPETKDLLGEICVEFIHLVSSEATDCCEKSAKKTIGGEHLMMALENLGFAAYAKDLDGVSDEHKNQTKTIKEKKTSIKNAAKNSGLTPEELLQAQAQLFAQSRLRMMSSGALGGMTPQL